MCFHDGLKPSTIGIACNNVYCENYNYNYNYNVNNICIYIFEQFSDQKWNLNKHQTFNFQNNNFLIKF